MKITILMPTYNDAHFIGQAIGSVIMQSYPNWELLIFDDASTDETKSIISHFEGDQRIQYFREECNKDQLNALYQLIPYVTGDVITLLHSDDVLLNENVLANIASYFESNDNIDGIYADLLLIDSSGNFRGFLKSPNSLSKRIILNALLSMGANVINDIFCVRKTVFFNCVVRNYVLWNTLYWINFVERDLKILNILKVPPWYCYRIGDNYLTKPSEIRQAFVLSGRYRTLVELSRYYYAIRGFSAILRLPKAHRLVWRFSDFFAKRIFDESLAKLFGALERNALLLKRLMASYRITSPVLRRFFEAPIEYMLFLKRNKTVLDLKPSDIEEQRNLFGKDAKVYYQQVLSNSVVKSTLHRLLLDRTREIKAVRVDKLENVKPIRDILRFLNLPLPILLETEDDKPENVYFGFERRFSWE